MKDLLSQGRQQSCDNYNKPSVIEEIYRNDELTHDYRKGDMVWVLWLLAFASAMIEVAIIYGITRVVELTSGG